MAPTTITPSKTRQVFCSPVDNFRLVRISERRTPLPSGVEKLDWPGLRYEFGSDGYVVIDDERRRFEREYFEKYGDKLGLDPDEVESPEEWLRNHRLYNTERGFVEIPATLPGSSPALSAITDAVLEGDIPKLIELYEEEEREHGRQDVLDSAKKAIEQLEAQAEERQAQRETVPPGTG